MKTPAPPQWHCRNAAKPRSRISARDAEGTNISQYMDVLISKTPTPSDKLRQSDSPDKQGCSCPKFNAAERRPKYAMKPGLSAGEN